jgi:hypothetical protein
MTAEPARPASRRKADTLALLTEEAADVWVATASAEGGTASPHLVPVSLGWLDDDRAVIAIPTTSRTTRNLLEHGLARLAVGPTRDVVMIDAELDAVFDVAEAPAPVTECFVAQADWDPRTSSGYSFLVLRPTRIQAWREANEIPDRTLMRDGHWLV